MKLLGDTLECIVEMDGDEQREPRTKFAAVT